MDVRQERWLLRQRSRDSGTQIVARLDTSEFGTFEQRVEHGRDLRAAHGLAACEVLSADDGSAHTAFGGVVAERYAWVIEEHAEAVPLVVQIDDGLPQATARQRALRASPRRECLDQRLGPRPPRVSNLRERARASSAARR